MRFLVGFLVMLCLGLAASPAAAAADHDCSNFSTQAAAQAYFDGQGYSSSNDPERLDSDGDGRACESNPCPCAGPGQTQTPPPVVPPPAQEPPKATCADGIDNDNDGKVDAPGDPGCADANDQDEADPVVTPPTVPSKKFSARVAKVVDGDTIRVRRSSGKLVTVRLLGIDTPETKKPGVGIECGGKQATAYTTRLALKKMVTVVTDATQDAVDRYGRTLAYVTVVATKQDVGRQLLRAGWAASYVYANKPVQRFAAYDAAAKEARSARRGVYGSCAGNFHSRQ